jgi:hypothetical protein
MEPWRIPAAVGIIVGICLLVGILDARDRARSRNQGRPYLVWQGLSFIAKINIVTACIALILACLLMTFLPPWIAQHQAEPGAGRALFWLQTVAGNWSPPPDFPKDSAAVSNLLLSRLGVVALVMNAGSVYFLITILLGVLSVRRRQKMRLIDAFNTRDSAIITSLVKTLSEAALEPSQKQQMVTLLASSMKEGHNLWLNQVMPSAGFTINTADLERQVAEGPG